MSAQEFHVKMTGGWYLWYTHESFLQNYMAIQLFNNKHNCVYVDASPKKIREYSATARKKQPMNPQQRFDIVCWLKTEKRVKAIIEIVSGYEKARKSGDSPRFCEIVLFPYCRAPVVAVVGFRVACRVAATRR